MKKFNFQNTRHRHVEQVVLFVTMIRHFDRCPHDTQCMALFRCDRKITQYTHDENWVILL